MIFTVVTSKGSLSIPSISLRWSRGDVLRYELSKGNYSATMTISLDEYGDIFDNDPSDFSTKGDYLQCDLKIEDSTGSVTIKGSVLILSFHPLGTVSLQWLQNDWIFDIGNLPDQTLYRNTQKDMVDYSGLTNEQRKAKPVFLPSTDQLYGIAFKGYFPNSPRAIRMDKFCETIGLTVKNMGILAKRAIIVGLQKPKFPSFSFIIDNKARYVYWELATGTYFTWSGKSTGSVIATADTPGEIRTFDNFYNVSNYSDKGVVLAQVAYWESMNQWWNFTRSTLIINKADGDSQMIACANVPAGTYKVTLSFTHRSQGFTQYPGAFSVNVAKWGDIFLRDNPKNADSRSMYYLNTWSAWPATTVDSSGANKTDEQIAWVTIPHDGGFTPCWFFTACFRHTGSSYTSWTEVDKYTSMKVEPASEAECLANENFIRVQSTFGVNVTYGDLFGRNIDNFLRICSVTSGKHICCGIDGLTAYDFGLMENGGVLFNDAVPDTITFRYPFASRFMRYKDNTGRVLVEMDFDKDCYGNKSTEVADINLPCNFTSVFSEDDQKDFAKATGKRDGSKHTEADFDTISGLIPSYMPVSYDPDEMRKDTVFGYDYYVPNVWYPYVEPTKIYGVPCQKLVFDPTAPIKFVNDYYDIKFTRVMTVKQLKDSLLRVDCYFKIRFFYRDGVKFENFILMEYVLNENGSVSMVWAHYDPGTPPPPDDQVSLSVKGAYGVVVEDHQGEYPVTVRKV